MSKLAMARAVLTLSMMESVGRYSHVLPGRSGTFGPGFQRGLVGLECLERPSISRKHSTPQLSDAARPMSSVHRPK